MDKLECPIFHDFDGACCGNKECGFQKEMRIIPLDGKEVLTENLAAHHSATALLLLATILALGGLFALIQWEADLRHAEKTHQEASIQY